LNLNVLWAPWRIGYVSKASNVRSCIFCDALAKSDAESYIVFRGIRSFIIMNIYPYNTAHVMVAPYRHVPTFELLNDDELLDMIKLVKLSIKAIDLEYKPQGYNVGVNLGNVAGAGVESHLHIHVVPRWLGDTNFMTVIAGTKVIPEDINVTYSRLKKAINSLTNDEHPYIKNN